MTPIDDELRAALRARADGVSPSPDPLGGIERRASGIRRRRVGAALVSTAMAVAAVAVAVPLVTSGSSGAAKPDTYSTDQPTTAPVSPYVLDPESPWAFRGDRSLADEATPAVTTAWRAKHPGAGAITPLFAQRYEPSAQVEVLFLSREGSLTRLGYAQVGGGGASLVWEDAFEALQPASLVIPLPGDEVGRLLFVAAPLVDRIDYAPDGTTFTQLAQLAPGVATGPQEGTADARYRVLDKDGKEIDSGGTPARTSDSPDNLLTWMTRGAGESDLMAPAKAALADSLSATADEVELKILFAGDTDSAVRFLVGQAWKRGDRQAHTFGYAEGGTNGPQVHFGPVTPSDTQLVAFVVDSLPGTTTDLLVLVPRPGTGQLSYDDDATGSFRPVASGRSDLDGVGLVDRSKTATADRVEHLDGDGDLDNPLYRGPLAPFLCGDKECG